jgi:hypothetical protein
VVLNGFDLGAWPQLDHGSQWTILDGNNVVLMQPGPITILGSQRTTVNVNLVSNSGFKIQFGPDAFNVGIDNISFDSTTVVPLPVAFWLMLSCGAILLQRRK